MSAATCKQRGKQRAAACVALVARIGNAGLLSACLAGMPVSAAELPGAPSELKLRPTSNMRPASGLRPGLAQLGIKPHPDAAKAATGVVEPSSNADIAPPLRLASGKSSVVRLDSEIIRVAVGNPDTLDVILITPREIYLLGKQSGSTNVFLWSKGGKTTIMEVTVSIDTAGLQDTLRRVMPNEKGIVVSAAGDSLVLTGMVSDSVKVHRAVFLAEQFGGRKVINMLGTSNATQVMLEVKIAEVAKTVMDRLGARFDGSTVGGGSFRYGLLTQLLSGASGVASITRGARSISIDAEIRNGLVKILAEPTIMAVSGQEGTFLAGGKIFIPVPQASGTGTSITLEEKEFGVGLRFTPTVLEGGLINLRVTPEVSELSQIGVPFTSTNGTTSVLPSITTRRASTTVQLLDGQSFAIGGLVKNNVTETIRRFPGLGDVPVLGALFRSSEFQNDVSELLIIVTPRLVKPLSALPELPTDNFVAPTRTEFLLEGKIEGKAPAVKSTPSSQSQGQSGTDAVKPGTTETPKELR